MSYAEVYRKRNAPWRKALRGTIFCAIVGTILYLSLQLLASQSGLMMGGTIR